MFNSKHESTGRVMRIEKTPNCLLLYKKNFVYKIRKDGNKYVKVRNEGGKEIIEELTKTEMKKFGNKIQKFFSS